MKREYGTCQFRITKCWFKHDEHQTIHANDDKEHLNENNQDVIEKLFNIVEQCTERIVHLENKN
jgi:hypothetical protein